MPTPDVQKDNEVHAAFAASTRRRRTITWTDTPPGCVLVAEAVFQHRASRSTRAEALRRRADRDGEALSVLADMIDAALREAVMIKEASASKSPGNSSS